MVLTASPVQIDTPGDLEDTKGDSPVSEEEKKRLKLSSISLTSGKS